MKTREEAIKWVADRLNEYTKTETGRQNVELVKLYFETSTKTGITVMNDAFAYIHYLFPYLAEKNMSVEQLNEDHISEIASRMHQKPSSVHVMVRNILAFLNWVRGRKRLQPLSMKYIAIKRGEVQSTIIEDRMTDEHVRLILNNLKKDEDKLAVLLMATYGLRISEALGVRFSDFEVTPKGSILTIRYRPGDYGAKGVKGERRISSVWLKRNGLVTDEYASMLETLVVKLAKKYGKDARLVNKSKRSVQYAIERAAKRAGIPFRMHPHLFRHHFVAKAIRLHVPLNELTNITGDRPETLNKYYSWLSPEAMLE